MKAAEKPANEVKRIEALNSYCLLDTPSEESFDSVVQLAAHICQVPVALVSLIDSERQWFKAKTGIDVPQTPRDISFCGHAIHGREVFVVENAKKDPRFSDNPLVKGPPNIVFYAGAPLIVKSGHAVGTLCVIDYQERRLTGEQLKSLEMLSKQVVHLFELKKANLQAMENDRKLKMLAESVRFGVWDWDIKKNLLEWDLSMYAMYGVDPEKFAGAYQAWEQTVHPDDKARSVQELQDALDGRKPFDTFFRVIRGDGQVQHVGAKAHIERDPEGKPVRASGVNWDSTAAFELREELEEETLRLKTLLASMGEGVVIQNQSGAIEEHNQAACEILGLSADEMMGRKSIDPRWRSILEDGTDFPGVDHPAMVALRTGKAQIKKVMGVHRPIGDLRWLQVSAVPFEFSSTGEVLKVLATFSDITVIKEAEQKFKRVFDNSPVGLLILDRDLKCIESNATFQKMLGYSYSELLGRSVVEFSHPDDLEQDKDSTINSQDPKFLINRLQKRLLTKDGRELWVQIAARPFRGLSRDGKGNIFASVVDITENRTLELRLEVERAKSVQSAKLASLGEMAAGIAHEINNPLAIIEGTCALMAKLDEPSRLPTRVETIRKSTARISKIVKGLRKFARSSDNDERTQVGIAALLREVQGLTEHKAKRHNVDLSFELGLESKILCNEIEIEQVFINLINNAIDAAEKNQPSWVRVSMLDQGDTIRVRVTDSGQGLTKALQERLFQPFFTTKSVGEGTGLGLSIAKGIVEGHGGTLNIVSDSPNTCFEVILIKQK